VPPREHYIGLMSGTSLDGIDGVLADFGPHPCATLAAAYRPFPAALRVELMALQSAGADELHRASLAGLALADAYAEIVHELISTSRVEGTSICAIGCHGQTVRHRPELGYTLQINNPARLAERTGITVVADFRSRDVAAGGQGAPLVPAFHASLFGCGDRHRVVVNIGGFANLTDLPPGGAVRGWDTGPGNVLLDLWCERHLGTAFDRDGAWAASGHVRDDLLARLAEDDYFGLPPPKSTGRDFFHLDWLTRALRGDERPEDVQATLLALTAKSIADAIKTHCAAADEILLCGGGAYNAALVSAIADALAPRAILRSEAIGVAANHVEALAFAWLARQTLLGLPGNLPAVTGARGERVLGAIYPGG
jgi:anhydro-N-acetylmuramic acid kinase